MQKISVVLPVYNEEQTVAQVIDELVEVMKKTEYDWEIIAVDDGSTDQSANIIKGKQITLVQHGKNRGTGAARTTGVRHTKGDVIVMIDADCTYPTSQIPELLKYLPDYDMVIGARKKEAGTYRLLRMTMKYTIRKLAEIVAQEKIPDLNSGFRAFKKAKVLKFASILPNTHSWVSTITLAFLSAGFPIKYVPIDYFPRKDHSTFHPLIDTYNYMSLVVRTLMYFNPLRIFLPLASMLLILGVGKTVFDLYFLKNMQESDIVIIISAVIVAAIGLLADLIVAQGKLRSNSDL